jgi:hypothetical protein
MTKVSVRKNAQYAIFNVQQGGLKDFNHYFVISTFGIAAKVEPKG